jgi:hypothetical protein
MPEEKFPLSRCQVLILDTPYTLKDEIESSLPGVLGDHVSYLVAILSRHGGRQISEEV